MKPRFRRRLPNTLVDDVDLDLDSPSNVEPSEVLPGSVVEKVDQAKVYRIVKAILEINAKIEPLSRTLKSPDTSEEEREDALDELVRLLMDKPDGLLTKAQELSDSCRTVPEVYLNALRIVNAGKKIDEGILRDIAYLVPELLQLVQKEKSGTLTDTDEARAKVIIARIKECGRDKNVPELMEWYEISEEKAKEVYTLMIEVTRKMAAKHWFPQAAVKDVFRALYNASFTREDCTAVTGIEKGVVRDPLVSLLELARQNNIPLECSEETFSVKAILSWKSDVKNRRPDYENILSALQVSFMPPPGTERRRLGQDDGAIGSIHFRWEESETSTDPDAKYVGVIEFELKPDEDAEGAAERFQKDVASKLAKIKTLGLTEDSITSKVVVRGRIHWFYRTWYNAKNWFYQSKWLSTEPSNDGFQWKKFVATATVLTAGGVGCGAIDPQQFCPQWLSGDQDESFVMESEGYSWGTIVGGVGLAAGLGLATYFGYKALTKTTDDSSSEDKTRACKRKSTKKSTPEDEDCWFLNGYLILGLIALGVILAVVAYCLME